MWTTYKHTLPEESGAVIATFHSIFHSRHLSVVFLLSSESLWPPGLLVQRWQRCQTTGRRLEQAVSYNILRQWVSLMEVPAESEVGSLGQFVLQLVGCPSFETVCPSVEAVCP